MCRIRLSVATNNHTNDDTSYRANWVEEREQKVDGDAHVLLSLSTDLKVPKKQSLLIKTSKHTQKI